MGSCISKCVPNNKHYSIDIDEEFDRTEDKLVISQPTKTAPNISVSNKVSPLPLSPTASSSSSVSSFTRTTGNTVSSCSSISSSSSVLSSKDRSFSNEFLWACVKEHPHIVRINSIKEASLALSTAKLHHHHHAPKSESPARPIASTIPAKQSIQQRQKGFTPKKRGRSSSPSSSTLTRQKSFRKESDDQRLGLFEYSLPSRALRSPSPSRRFSGENSREIFTSTQKGISRSKRHSSSRVTPVNSTPVSSSLRRENFKPTSDPIASNSIGLRPFLRNRETCIHRISSKIDEIAVGAALSTQQDGDCIPMEDIDNPLISLDCFIFL